MSLSKRKPIRMMLQLRAAWQKTLWYYIWLELHHLNMIDYVYVLLKLYILGIEFTWSLSYE